PSAIAGGVTVLLAGMTAREMGGGRRAQLIAAACTAVSATTLVTGHFVSTTTYDVMFSAALTWLLARSVRTGESWLLLPAGLALGLGLLNKPLIGVLAAALLVGIALAGPRRLLRSGWLWAGAAVVAVCGAPYLVWQALNGWPELHMAGSIAGGDAQGGRIGFIPFQLLLVSPVLAPVWIAGLVRVFRAGPAVPVPRHRLSAARGRLPARRRQGLLPRRDVPGAAGGRRDRHRRLAARRARARPAAGRRAGAVTGRRRGRRAGRAPGPGARPGARTQPGRRRAGRVAALRRPGSRGLEPAARLAAGDRGGAHPELRRGRRHRPLRAGGRAAGRLQRAQRVRQLGAAVRAGRPGRGRRVCGRLGARAAVRRLRAAGDAGQRARPRHP